MTLYAIKPDPVTGELEGAEVADRSKYGWDFLEQSIDLWGLVDTQRAEQLRRVADRAEQAANGGELRFYEPDLRELVALLAGIEDAIVAAGIVDHEWRVAADQLEQLARKVPSMDLSTERSIQAKTSALGEIMINAGSLRLFIQRALDEGNVIALG